MIEPDHPQLPIKRQCALVGISRSAFYGGPRTESPETHRIHYDRRYATEVEGYPGLVVHGPMQAALLCSYATALRRAPPRRFSFRGLSPLFDDDAFGLNATEDGDGLKLWTARENGPVGMAAEASWT